MKVLITGASGYIGSQTCKYFKEKSIFVYALDRNQIKHSYYDIKIINNFSEFSSMDFLKEVDCVIHLAGSNLVGPSISAPQDYYLNNVSSTINLLSSCLKAGVNKFVFASSAAVYGNTKKEICSEDDSINPISPYGWSKYMIEIILKDFARAYNFNSISLRFFNVAGADFDNKIGPKKSSSHIISRLLEKSFLGESFILNGDKYDTKDGTCIRDYVHVEDVANGLFMAAKYTSLNKGATVFNLGEGSGYSNAEIIKSIEKNTPLKPEIKVGPPVKGDMKILVSDTYLVNNSLGWQTKYKLDDIIKTSYNWYKKIYQN